MTQNRAIVKEALEAWQDGSDACYRIMRACPDLVYAIRRAIHEYERSAGRAEGELH